MGRPNDHDQTTRLTKALSEKVVKRSVTLKGHATSVSLERPYWEILNKIAEHRQKSLNSIIAEIDSIRGTNLSSAIRLYVLYHIEENPAYLLSE